jgi:predicted dehydrogenase
VIAQINFSWTTRVKRDDLVTFQVDGTLGSAVAGLSRCFTQHRVNTPRPVWNPDMPQTLKFEDQWELVPDNAVYENGFKIQWEDFLRHVAANTPWKYDLIEGAKGVQLAELGRQSWLERRVMDVAALEV